MFNMSRLALASSLCRQPPTLHSEATQTKQRSLAELLTSNAKSKCKLFYKFILIMNHILCTRRLIYKRLLEVPPCEESSRRFYALVLMRNLH